MGKIRAIIINNDKTLTEKTVKTKEKQAFITKNWIVDFNADDVIIKDNPSTFGRLFGSKTKRFIIVREGKTEAEKITFEKDLWSPLTIEEKARFTKRLMLKSKLDKPQTNITYVTILLGIISIALLVALLFGVRIR